MERDMKIPAENKTPVLILSAHAIALGIVRALSSRNIPLYLVSYDKMDMAHKSKYIKGHYVLPHPEHHAEAFVDGLKKIGTSIGKAIVFPADDPTLVTLAKHVNELSSYFILPTPDWSVVEKVISKDLTYSIAERIGIPVPRTVRVNNNEPFPADLLKNFKFPFLVKPAQSHLYVEAFHRKMDVIDNSEDLEQRLGECRKMNIDVTVQEIIDGGFSQGFNFNSLFYDGRIKLGFTASKVRMTENGYGIPSVVKSREMVAELWEYSERLLQALDYQGYSCIEYKYDASQQTYKLLEINGRYNRSSLLGMRSGVNFPLIEYDYLTNGQDFGQQEYQHDVYYIDEFRDLQTCFRNILTGKQNIFSFLKPYCSKHVKAVFSIKDPKPFLKRLRDGMMLIAQSGKPICFKQQETRQQNGYSHI